MTENINYPRYIKYNQTPRDAQRQKLYDAERTTSMWSFNGTMTMDEIKTMVEKIRTSRWLSGQYPGAGNMSITIKDGRRCRTARGTKRAIVMPRWSRSELIVLHELAHVIAWRVYNIWDIQSHGREFAQIYLQLIKRWIGIDACNEMKKAFRAGHVKFGRSQLKPHEPGPEALQKLLSF